MLPTEEDLALRRKRRAWWLSVARRARGRTQEDVAKYLSLKAGSSIGDFERNVIEPSLKQVALFAALYEVPLSLFTDPPMTDEERFLELARAAEVLEQQDWEVQQEQAPGAGAGRAGGRRKAS